MPSARRLLVVACLSIVATAHAQDRGADGRARNPGLTGWCETPVAQRKAEPGCYTTAVAPLSALPAEPVYWHIDSFADRSAAEANKGPRSTAVDGHGKHYLFSIEGPEWRARNGERVASIGPLAVDRNASYTAHYLETVILPGFQDGNNGHRHPGPEAWYVVSGGQCLETPNGVMIGYAGDKMLAPEGWPMAISSLGPDTRRALVLVLHRSGEPYSMAVNAKPDAPHAQWKPQGRCPKDVTR